MHDHSYSLHGYGHGVGHGYIDDVEEEDSNWLPSHVYELRH
jgi:hypothetical protein